MADDPLNPERIPTPLSGPFEAQREGVMERLQDGFASGDVTLEEFDERMELARTASSEAELEVLVSDLPETSAGTALVSTSGEESLPARSNRSTALVPTRGRGAPLRLTALFGSSEQKGEWSPPERIRARAVFGSVTLDFRRADLAPASVTEVECTAVFGSIEILVSPGMLVETSGSGILGSFVQLNTRGQEDEGAPVIRISGRAVFGAVEVKVVKPKRGLLEHIS